MTDSRSQQKGDRPKCRICGLDDGACICAHLRPYPVSADAHLKRIITGLFNPMPDRHPKGCLANENGPCICGYAEVAGEYLWALREAKKIAVEHFGQEAVDQSRRLEEPHALVEAALTRAPAQAPVYPGSQSAPDAWQYRENLGSDWGDWFCLNIPIEKFKEDEKHAFEDGLYEIRPLYTAPQSVSVAQGAGNSGAWQPIETAPKDGTSILIGAKSGLVDTAHWSYGCWGGWIGPNEAVVWQPIPTYSVTSTSSASPRSAAFEEATQAQHFDVPKGEPARFVRNGELKTCQCSDCRAITSTDKSGAA